MMHYIGPLTSVVQGWGRQTQLGFCTDGNEQGNNINTKQWKTQEVASYSPAQLSF